MSEKQFQHGVVGTPHPPQAVPLPLEGKALSPAGKDSLSEEPIAAKRDLYGIWADDTAVYLTDLRHPVMREEWTRWQLNKGRRYNSPLSSERERRDFDRAMVAKYAEQCPPPARTPWQLMAYGILDGKEDLEARQRLAASQRMNYERVYIDEDI